MSIATNLDAIIRQAVTKRVEEVTAEELDFMYRRVVQRMNQEADRLALECLRYYEISSTQDKIVITVRKTDEPQK